MHCGRLRQCAVLIYVFYLQVGVALDIYGPAGDVCWISGDNYLHQFFLDGLIAVLSIAWNLFVIVRSVCIIKRQKARMTAENGIVLRMMCVVIHG